MSPAFLHGICPLLFLGVIGSPITRNECNTSNFTTTVLSLDPATGASSAATLDPALAALSIEFCYILDYLGDVNNPNQLSLKLLQNVQNISGAPPRIRIGGHTQDVTRYNATNPETLTNIFEAGNTEAVNVTYNADLFRVLNENVVPQQEYIFGLNFGQDNVTYPLEEVAAAEKYLDPAKLWAYELGNEPDFYSSSQRPPPWNVQTYEQQQVTWLNEISGEIENPTHGFQIGAFAQEPIYQGNFSLLELNKLGLPQSVRNIRSYSDHTYPFSICTEETAALVSLPNLMNHINTIQYFSQWQIEVAAAEHASVNFHIGETGSVSCHGKDGVSNTLGAALWEIDYMLHGATLGFHGIYFHMGTPFFYSMWQPVPYNNTPAKVYPTYYSLLFYADLIADIPSPTIRELSAFESDALAVYAVFDEGSNSQQVEKIVILNLGFYNDTTVERTMETVEVRGVFGEGEEVEVGRLTGPMSVTTEAAEVMWLGVSYAEGDPVGTRGWEGVRCGGLVDVRASEAVIVRRKGTGG